MAASYEMVYFCAQHPVKTLHIHCISVSIVFNGCITINSVFLCTAPRDNITKILHCDAPYTQHCTTVQAVFLCPIYIENATQILFPVSDVFSGCSSTNAAFPSTPSSDGIKNTAFLCIGEIRLT